MEDDVRADQAESTRTPKRPIVSPSADSIQYRIRLDGGAVSRGDGQDVQRVARADAAGRFRRRVAYLGTASPLSSWSIASRKLLRAESTQEPERSFSGGHEPADARRGMHAVLASGAHGDVRHGRHPITYRPPKTHSSPASAAGGRNREGATAASAPK